jgi:hypothetical protein
VEVRGLLLHQLHQVLQLVVLGLHRLFLAQLQLMLVVVLAVMETHHLFFLVG